MTVTLHSYRTTLDGLPVECECSAEDGDVIVEAVFVEAFMRMTGGHHYGKPHDILEFLSDGSLETLRTKCQEFYDENQQ